LLPPNMCPGCERWRPETLPRLRLLRFATLRFLAMGLAPAASPTALPAALFAALPSALLGHLAHQVRRNDGGVSAVMTMCNPLANLLFPCHESSPFQVWKTLA